MALNYFSTILPDLQCLCVTQECDILFLAVDIITDIGDHTRVLYLALEEAVTPQCSSTA